MTDPAAVVEDASPQDAAAIVSLLRCGFEPAILELAVYGCDGVEQFVADHLRMGVISPYRYKVVRGAAGLLGVAEFRVIGATLFLNYVAVRPEGRGRGLGTQLLRRMGAEARATGLTRFALDVFISNAGPLDWYERLGMRAEAERSFWLGPLERSAEPVGFFVPDLPQADAVHARFGFSELRLQRGDRTVAVGRIGARFFRLGNWQAAGDEELRSCLASLDPGRRLLAIVEGRPRIPSTWEPCGVSRRMGIALGELRL